VREGMKKLIALFLALAVLVFDCHTHINKVKDKWGPPAKDEFTRERKKSP
jgi:hypothetical protein